jgi:hypothetical protein
MCLLLQVRCRHCNIYTTVNKKYFFEWKLSIPNVGSDGGKTALKNYGMGAAHKLRIFFTADKIVNNVISQGL